MAIFIENELQKLLNLRDMQEHVINGFVFTCMQYETDKEWKFSPYGLLGDFDKDHVFLHRDELRHHLLEIEDQHAPVFKQDTPKMQAISLLQGIEGHAMNWHNGIKPTAKALENMILLVEHLKAVHAWLPEEW